MASRHVQKILSPRSRLNSLTQEREHFEKVQSASIHKAINPNELPVKEKHVRRIIIGTYQERSGHTFWEVVRRSPVQENPVICWKFCHLLHKVLREGYRRVIADSYINRQWIQDLGRLWVLCVQSGYGKLINRYCSLLVNKIDFHMSNPRIPGNLQLTDEELESIGEQDVNIFFQLSCELFDYLDEILNLQAEIFASLDMSRCSSMTNQGQCRLAPLIPCIQDSSVLYDFSVKVLFRLHSVLPISTLDGHRQRFLQQYKILKQFYYNSSNLQYFRNLIQVPTLPESPPNFLLASDLDSHVTPVVIVPQDSEGVLVDLNYEEEMAKYDESNDHDEFSLMSTDRERERLQFDFDRYREEQEQMSKQLRSLNTELQMRAVELEQRLTGITMEKDSLLKEKEDLRAELGRMHVGTDVQTEKEKAQEKFAKMREIYSTLREEHIQLLRQKAEVDKELIALKGSVEQASAQRTELEQRAAAAAVGERELDQINEKLKTSETLNKKLLSEISAIQMEKNQFDEKFSSYSKNEEKLKRMLEEVRRQLADERIKIRLELLSKMFKKQAQVYNRTLQEDLHVATSGGGLGSSADALFEHLDQILFEMDEHNALFKKLSSEFLSDNSLLSIENLMECSIGLHGRFLELLGLCQSVDQLLPDMQTGHDLLLKCKSCVGNYAQFLIKSAEDENMFAQEHYYRLRQVKLEANELLEMKQVILPQMQNKRPENLQELLMKELSEMEKAIQEAAGKIGEMLEVSKQKDEDIKLEVNGKILDSCTTLMSAIMRLVNDSRELQKEIFLDGKGQTNPKEFYQKNHRWTEGLISAAKVVAFSAKLLVDTADNVISGQAEFETLIVASQEIGSATAQLVAASKVKARPGSEKMKQLLKSSKEVTSASGQIIAVTRNSIQLMREQNEPTERLEEELRKLSVHQAKKMEMESQLRIIQLEDQLNKERVRLAQLRKTHYHLSDEQ